MITGLGTDIVHIPRIEMLLERFGVRFLNKIFTAEEQNLGKTPAHFAKRFAAKEACAKALGTGFRHGVSFHDMVIKNDGLGKPIMLLSGKTAELLGNNRVHVSLSDDYPVAFAVVIIEGA